MREDWIKTSIGELCIVNLGQSPPSSSYNSKGEGLPFFQGKAEFTNLYPVAKKWCNEPKKTAKSGDILLSVRAPVGATNLADQLCAIGRGLAAITYEYCTNYVLYYLNFSESDLDSKGTGTTFKAVSGNTLKNFDIPLAPLPEQRAIVAKIEELFSELDKGEEDLKRAQEQLKIYRQAVLKKAFEGELTKKWREQQTDLPTADELKAAINDFNNSKTGQNIPSRLPPINLTDLGVLPNGWTWIEAHKICSSVRDGTHDTPKYIDKGVPLVTSKNLKSEGVDLVDVKFISKADHLEISKRSAVDKGDLLFGMIGTIGNPVIVKKANAFSIKNVGLFKKNEALLRPNFLWYFLSSAYYLQLLDQKELIRGTTQKFVSLGGLRVSPLPIPSIIEQHQIVQEIESRLSVCDSIEESIHESLDKSKALRQSILKKAFEGTLLSEEEIAECKAAPDYEPASVLLERIKAEKKKN